MKKNKKLLKKFLILSIASFIGFFVFVILHNLIFGLFKIEEPVFFILAVIVCPIGLLVGVVGSVTQLDKKYQILFAVFVLILILGYSLYLISKSRTFQFFGGLTARVNTDQKVVALTFDDAPSPYVKEVLGILKEKQIKATFYEIGQNIEKYPVEAKLIVDAGMEVGNHSYSHQRLLLKTQSFIDTEIQKTNNLIRNSGYNGEITFRPPNGKKLFGLPWYLSKHNIKTIMWDVEPDTYAPNDLTGYTINNVKPGSIILIHPFCDACSKDREVIGKIIDELKSKGYKFVTISELLTF